MAVAQEDRAVLERFRHALDAAYGSRLERVVLYGSRARGDARPDSEYDIAVRIGMDILDETGAVINAFPFGAGAYNERTGLMSELRRDGIDL